MVIRDNLTRRSRGKQIFDISDQLFNEDADTKNLDAARGASRRTADRHAEYDDQQRAARNNRGHLIDANGLKTRRRKRRDNSKHRAAEKHRKAVVDIGGA